MSTARQASRKAIEEAIAALGPVPENCRDDVEMLMRFGSQGKVMALAMIMTACMVKGRYHSTLRTRLNRIVGPTKAWTASVPRPKDA